MKTNVLALAASLPLLATLTGTASAAVSIPAAGVTVDFAAVPSGADFASVSVAGGGGDLTDLGTAANQIDNATTGISTSLVWPAAPTNWALVPGNSIDTEPAASNLLAGVRHVVTPGSMLTGPTGNRYQALIGRFQNTAGSAISSVDLAWTLGSPVDSGPGTGAVGTDPLAGIHVYFSKSGLAGSWTRLNGPFGAPDGPVAAATITIPGRLANLGELYIAWIDDNGPGSGTPNFEGNYTVDDVVISNVVQATCSVTAAATGPTRTAGVDPADPADDRIIYSAVITGTGTVGPGWVVAAGSPSAGTTGAYSSTLNLDLPVSDFTGGPLPLKIADQADDTCYFETTLTAPPFIHSVTAANSPTITFTPSAVGDGSYVAPLTTVTEPGWSGGTNGVATANSNVQTQPPPSAETLKYFHLTTNGTSLTTDPVNVSALKGALVQGEMEFAFYSTSTSGLDAGDVLNFRLEVAQDGNFANAAAGNIIIANIQDVPAGTATAFGDSIAVGPAYINLAAPPAVAPAVDFPATDFVFHKLNGNAFIPATASNPRARIVAQSITGITNTEHVLIDNIVFRTNTSPALTTSTGAVTWSNNNTVTAADDTISVPVTVTGLNLGASTGWTSNGTPAAGNYADAQPVIFTAPASASPVTVTLTDNQNPGAISSFTLTRPAATLTSALVVGPIVRNENAAGDADDTVTFDISVASTNAGPAFTATAGLVPATVTGAGTYPPVGTAVLTLGNLPNGATTINVVIADASYPAAPAPVTIAVAVPASTAAPGAAVIGRKDFGAGLSDVGVATQGPEWIHYAGNRSMVMTAGIATDSVVESEVLDLSSVGAVAFTANLRARETSAGSNFDIGDRFKAELLIDGATIVPLITAAMDAGDGASAIVDPGVNGPPNGYLNGYTGAAGTDFVTAVVYAAAGDDYNANRIRDEFNTAGVNAAALMDSTIPLSALIPEGANSVQFRIYGAGVAGSESFTVQNVLFTGTSAGGDTDGDGVSDADEVIMGTSPTDASDVLRLSQSPGNANLINFPTKNGRFYRVYVSSDANAVSHLRSWNDSGLATIPGNGNPASFSIIVTAGVTRRFYSLHVMTTDGPWPAVAP